MQKKTVESDGENVKDLRQGWGWWAGLDMALIHHNVVWRWKYQGVFVDFSL